MDIGVHFFPLSFIAERMNEYVNKYVCCKERIICSLCICSFVTDKDRTMEGD
jgi:hypothetical protein